MIDSNAKEPSPVAKEDKEKGADDIEEDGISKKSTGKKASKTTTATDD